MPTPSDATGPVTAYAASRNISIASEEPLGAGQDGTVWLTSRETAIKALNRERNYLNERDSYRLLTERSIDRIGIFDVPKLVDTDDELWIVEMGVVSPPYFLDFGKAYVNRSPPYTSEQLAESLYESEQLFEPADWPLVEAAVLDLKLSGIHYLDIKPANIRVRSEREEPPSTICDRVNDSWEQTIPEYERTARGKCVIHRYHRFANLGTQINRILEQAAYRFGRRRFKTSKQTAGRSWKKSFRIGFFGVKRIADDWHSYPARTATYGENDTLSGRKGKTHHFPHQIEVSDRRLFDAIVDWERLSEPDREKVAEVVRSAAIR